MACSIKNMISQNIVIRCDGTKKQRLSKSSVWLMSFHSFCVNLMWVYTWIWYQILYPTVFVYALMRKMVQYGAIVPGLITSIQEEDNDSWYQRRVPGSVCPVCSTSQTGLNSKPWVLWEWWFGQAMERIFICPHKNSFSFFFFSLSGFVAEIYPFINVLLPFK